jgi:TnpA family transposase
MLVGLQFAPRIPNLKHRRLYSFGKPSAYPALEPMIAGRINVELIRAHWSEILRIIASIRTGTATASLIMRQLASHQRQNGLAAALRELGRMERAAKRVVGPWRCAAGTPQRQSFGGVSQPGYRCTRGPDPAQ